jgi:hypothetical protein
MPTVWEQQNGLDPLADDAALNPDNDGLTNLQEYRTGTDPQAETPGPGVAVLVSPDHLATGQALSLPLETGYSATGLESLHARTCWQISLDPNFPDDDSTDAILDITSENHKTGITVPLSVLEPGTPYYWRAGYIDSDGLLWPWSESRMFTATPDSGDGNDNGLPDDQEVAAGTTSDLDADGNDDLSQADMHCVALADGSGWTCLKDTAAITVEEFYSIDSDAIADTDGRPDNLPCGLFGFRIAVGSPGDSVTVSKYYSTALPENVSWYKYDSINGWFDYSGYVTISGDRRSVAIELTDGGYGDADGVANGIIVDPSGPSTGDDSGANDPRSGSGGGGGCFINAVSGDHLGMGGGACQWVIGLATLLTAGVWMSMKRV